MAIEPTSVAWASARHVSYLLRQSFRYEYSEPSRDLNHRLVVIPPERFGDQLRVRHKLSVAGDGKLVPDAELVSEPLGRNDDEAVVQVAARLGVLVAEALPKQIGHVPCRRPGDRRRFDRHQSPLTSSAQTVIDWKAAEP